MDSRVRGNDKSVALICIIRRFKIRVNPCESVVKKCFSPVLFVLSFSVVPRGLRGENRFWLRLCCAVFSESPWWQSVVVASSPRCVSVLKKNFSPLPFFLGRRLLPRNDRYGYSRRILRRMINPLGGGHRLRSHPEFGARVRVPVESVEVAARDLDAYPVARLHDMACRPEIDIISVHFVGLDV